MFRVQAVVIDGIELATIAEDSPVDFSAIMAISMPPIITDNVPVNSKELINIDTESKINSTDLPIGKSVLLIDDSVSMFIDSLPLIGGVAPKKGKFIWTDDAVAILRECAANCREQNLMPFKKHLHQMFVAAMKTKLGNASFKITDNAVFSKLQALEKNVEPAPPKKITFNAEMNDILLRCGVGVLAKCDRDKTLDFRTVLLSDFVELVPLFKGTKYVLKQRFDDLLDKANDDAILDMHTEIAREVEVQEMENVVETDSLPRDLAEIRKYYTLGIEHGKKLLYRAVCSRCGRLAHGDYIKHQTFFLVNIAEDEEQLPIERYYENLFANVPCRVGDRAIVCRTCKSITNFTVQFNLRNPVTDKMTLPDQLELVRNNTVVLSRISLLNLYSQQHLKADPFHRVFPHLLGEVNLLTRQEEDYKRMFGIMAEKNVANVRGIKKTDNQLIRRALTWLRDHNTLFKDFYANGETMYPYLTRDQNLTNINAADNFETVRGRELSTELGNEEIAYFQPTDDVQQEIVDAMKADKTVATAHPKPDSRITAKRLATMQKAEVDSPNLEAKGFPVLYPGGTGSYKPLGKNDSRLNHVTHSNYCRSILVNLDPRFRENPRFSFFEYDRNIKLRLQGYAHMVIADVANAAEQPTVADLQKKDDENKDPYKKYGRTVPATIPGSRSYWWKAQQEVHAISLEAKRKPDYFLTLTANDNWPEVQRIIAHGIGQEDCENCPHLREGKYGKPAIDKACDCSIAFHERFQLFKKHVLHNPNGPLGKVEDYWYRREYQKRGATHIHCAIWVDPETKRDDVVTAEMPRKENCDIDDVPFREEIRDMILTLQTHTCRKERCLSVKGKRSNHIQKCKYSFPAPLINELRKDSTGLRFLYKRRKDEDRMIVPYNLQILLLFRAHVNIQHVSDSGWELYLTKYMCKPESASKIRFRRKDDKESDTTRFLKMRIVGSIEVYDHMLGFPASESSSEVIYLPVELQSNKKTMKRKQHLPEETTSTDVYYDSKIEKYLMRCPELSHVTYPNYFRLYSLRKTNIPMAEDDDYRQIEEIADTSDENRYKDGRGRRIYKRKSPAVIRWPFLLPYGDDIEKFCLKLLLQNIPWTNETIKDIFSPENVSKTYLQECVIRDLWHSRETSLAFLDEASKLGYTETRLREIAGQMIKCNYISKSEVMDIFTAMNDRNAFGHFETGILEDNCIGDPDDFHSKFPVQNLELLELEEYEQNFTQEQGQIFNYIRNKMENEEQILATIVGPAGTGKTFLIQAICALCRDKSNKKTCRSFCILAPTGTAAYLVKGQTIHSMFKVNFSGVSNIKPNSMEDIMIRHCDTFICDEMSMIDDALFILMEKVVRKYAMLEDRHLVFAGKDFIMFGDPAQLPSRNVPLFTTDLFRRFKPFVLKTLVRQSEDKEFMDALQDIRTGNASPQTITFLKTLVNPRVDYEMVIKENIVIIVSTLHTCREINAKILNMIPGEVFTFEAEDTNISGGPLTDDQHKRMLQIGNIPPMILELKINALVVLRRNLNTAAGHVNGRRGIVDAIHGKTVIVRSLTSDERWAVNMIKHEVEDYDAPAYIRTQIPLTLGWATTVHRVQGQTLPKAIVQLDSFFFESGQAYVALTRTRKSEDLQLTQLNASKIFLKPFFKQLLTWYDHHDLFNEDGDKEYPMPIWPPSEKKGTKRKREPVKLELEGLTLEALTGTPALKETSSPVVEIPTAIPVPNNDRELIATCEKMLDELWQKRMYNENLFQLRQYFQLNTAICERVLELLQVPNPIVYLNRPSNANDAMNCIPDDIREHLYPVNIRGDGNCFYYAVSQCIFGNQNYMPVVRLGALISIVRYDKYFRTFCTYNTYSFLYALVSAGTISSRERQVKNIYSFETNFSWGNTVTLCATSVACYRPIIVYSGGRTPNIARPRGIFTELDRSRCIFLTLHEYHYSAIVPTDNVIRIDLRHGNHIAYNSENQLNESETSTLRWPLDNIPIDSNFVLFPNLVHFP